ncbi:hypothetical protein A2863_02400 [Candidatus Woesebacteria bacterium RIFCSPHIGHO2_01_FULL_38_9b]|uniref:Uncharacterized protein n=1 Tax=Candidatus Woesebacteria bacterium RIFCSPHIGHO2_01_FULL_38_9b TaxID=1802493 RepID=A0A1F7Y0I3_9BACT|nr:MAG: hypothetical protein A2863_02400 [Candidatus Woesebacteria bacterium RIFCSPHIGHO2_01_FULL_38_9b]
MKLISSKNFLFLLAALLVVALGIMALYSYNKPKPKSQNTFNKELNQIKSQSGSDSLEAIEKDVNDTELNDIDKELQSIDNELN